MGIIEIRKLSKSYGEKVVFNGLDLEVDEGITALLGPNGSGKSTLIGIIAGAIKYKGECKILKFECNDVEKVHEKVSFSTENPLLPNVRVRELLELSNGDWKEIIKILGINFLESKFSKLSQGQRKLVSVAMALARNSDYYILDEPTANIDVGKRSRIYELITKKRNVLISSHELSDLVNIINKLIILKNGKVLFSGTLQDVKRMLEGQIMIKTDIPDTIKDKLGSGEVLGNVVIIRGYSIDEVLTRLRNFKDHIYSIETVNLETFYKSMVERL
jgi:ABC-2 type transport system ATP-binding protein